MCKIISNIETVMCCFIVNFTIISTETGDTSDNLQGTTHTGLQRSIEGLYLSVRQQKQNLYRQNGITTVYNTIG